MNGLALPWGDFGRDPWGLLARSDRTFGGAMVGILGIGLLLFLLSQNLPPAAPEIQPELVRTPPVLLSLAPPEATPAPKRAPAKASMSQRRQPAVVAKPAQKPRPESVSPPASAREVAQQAGLMALQGELQALQAAAVPKSSGKTLSKPQPRAASAAGVTPTLQHRGAGSDGTAAVSLAKGGAQLAGHHTGEVFAPEGPATAAAVPGAAVNSRDLEEIQMAFEQQKLAFYGLFNRAARASGQLQRGSVVVSLTISPRGEVTDCHIVSSSFRDPELHEKVLRRVRMMRFESRQVPEFTYAAYPITFIPS